MVARTPVVRCPVCGSPATESLIERPAFPAMQNGVFPTHEQARAAIRGDVFIRVCAACTFTFNAAFDDSVMQYDATYDNSIDESPAYKSYIGERVAQAMRGADPAARVLEIGCGKGSFIRRVVDTYPATTGLGVDATYEGELTAFNGRLTFERRFFDASDAGGHVDVAICRHVIEHVADPVAFLTQIRQGLTGAPDVRVIFETPSLEWIVENHAFWDVFYEHCNYFTGPALERCFVTAGFQVTSMQRVFGAQFWWVEATVGATTREAELPTNLFDDIVAFGRASTAEINALRRRFQALHSDGNLALWGAAAKGTTLANLIDPQAELITTMIDLNPRKQGCFVAGSGQSIESPPALITQDILNVIVVNPMYLVENTSIARALGSRAQIAALHVPQAPNSNLR